MSNKAGTPSSAPSEAVVLDVPFLDEYFLDWVVNRIRRIIQRLQHDGAVSSTDVLFKFLRPLAQCAVLLTTRAQTPATRLLGLQRVPTQKNLSTAASASTTTRRDYYFRLVAYTLFSTILPVLYTELKEWHNQRLRQRLATVQHETPQSVGGPGENQDHCFTDTIEQVASERQFQCADTLIQVVRRIWPLLRLTALLGVWTGVSRTSEIAMILTGWTYQKQQWQQQEPRLHVDYAQRRWIWEELLRSLRVWGQGLAIMSVWQNDVQRWKEYLLGLLARNWALGNRRVDPLSPSSLSSCCFCEVKPIIIPLKLHPCGHMACYACLHRRSKGNVQCRSCKLRVVNATSWEEH